MGARLLLLSNGHGEDAIGAALVPHLRAQGYALEALPIVGEGAAYLQLDVPLIGPTHAMPSGGFVYGRPAALAGDLAHGLVGLTRAQIAAVRATRGRYAGVVAIGDVVVLAFAWLARAPYVLVGCAKSDHYLGGRAGAYLWHERLLMRQARCMAVFPRDTVTTRNLQAAGVHALDLGNPMMDGLEPRGVRLPAGAGGPTILLLPGSRPEAPRNLALLAEAAVSVQTVAPGPAPRFLVAMARVPEGLELPGWQPDGDALVHPTGTRLHLVAGAFADAAHAADLAIALAGTATEQVVGLGKPVLTFAGPGPQFTHAFAEAQTRLLGPSVRLMPRDPVRIAAEVWRLLGDQSALDQIARNGRDRMGTPGASRRIAAEIASLWPLQPDHGLVDALPSLH